MIAGLEGPSEPSEEKLADWFASSECQDLNDKAYDKATKIGHLQKAISGEINALIPILADLQSNLSQRGGDPSGMGAAVGYIMPRRRAQLLAVVGEDLRVVCAARDGNVGHAVVEQVYRPQFGIRVDQHTVGSLHLAGMTRDRVPALPYPVTTAVNPRLNFFSPSLPTVRFVGVHSASLTSMQ